MKSLKAGLRDLSSRGVGIKFVCRSLRVIKIMFGWMVVAWSPPVQLAWIQNTPFDWRAHRVARAPPPTADAGEMSRLPLSIVGRPLTTMDTKKGEIMLSVLKSISEVACADWDACVHATASGIGGEPFLSHRFLHALESSGCVDPDEGWMVQHLVAHDTKTSRLLGAVPLYLKSHSYGEYVFDHVWARAYRSSVSDATPSTSGYYPKLLACVPFTPVAGARLLLAAMEPERRAKLRGVLARGLVALADRLGVSSVHVTFSSREDGRALKQEGFLPRLGVQFHWCNGNYSSFDDYLASLKQSRRKAVRQERRKVAEAGFKIHRLRGAQIERHHWDAFYRFYRAQVERESNTNPKLVPNAS